MASKKKVAAEEISVAKKVEVSMKTLESKKIKEAEKQKGIYSAMSGLEIVRN